MQVVLSSGYGKRLLMFLNVFLLKKDFNYSFQRQMIREGRISQIIKVHHSKGAVIITISNEKFVQKEKS